MKTPSIKMLMILLLIEPRVQDSISTLEKAIHASSPDTSNKNTI